MVRKSSSTLSPFIIDLRRHHHPRQLSSSPQLRHSFFFVRHEASSHHAAASFSIVFDPNKTVEPPSCLLRHRFNQSTPDRLPSSSRPKITGLLTIYVIQRHHAPSFLHHRRSFSSSMCRTLYYHQHESTDLLDMYTDGARTLRITSFGETRSSKGSEFKGHVLLGGIF